VNRQPTATRLSIPLVAVCLVVWLIHAFFLSQTNPLDEDELRIYHQAWQYAQGDLIFSDFVAFPYPAADALASWPFRFAESAFTAIRINRALAVFWFLGGCILLYRLTVRIFSRSTAAWTLVLWLGVSPSLLKAHEFRPVHLALFFALSCLLLYFEKHAERDAPLSRLFIAGAAAGLAFLFKPDVALLIIALGIAELSTWPSRRWRARIERTAALIAGGLVPIVIYTASFWPVDRISLYLFYQYVMVAIPNVVSDSSWNPGFIVQWELWLPFAFAAIAGLGLTLAGKTDWKSRKPAAIWMAVCFVLILLFHFRRPMYFQQNLFFLALVPAMLAGAGIRALVASGKIGATVLASALIFAHLATAAANVTTLNRDGTIRNRLEYSSHFERYVPQEECLISIDRLLSLPELDEETQVYYRLTLRDHRELLAFLAAIKADGAHVYDGLEAGTNLRGATYLNGFLRGSFHGEKFQHMHETLRAVDVGLARSVHESRFAMITRMAPDSAEFAAAKLLTLDQPEVLIVDAFIRRLARIDSEFKATIADQYDICVLRNAHSFVALKKGLVPSTETWCR
jgi:Dolichyl-phosphate-mannose-protein mannosyltransferase